MTLLIATGFPLTTIADWDPGDGYKMHFPQLPDPNGWDIHATVPIELADDWQCTETGYVQDIHFWGSWLDDRKGVITSFIVTIYADIPIDESPTGYSIPGEELWTREIIDWVERGPYNGDQGWYWPENGIFQWHNHEQYYQYNIYLDDPWFLQEENNIYWLGISANVQIDSGIWGWKSSLDHWNDNAVWNAPGAQWINLFEPSPPITNQFWLTMSERQPVEGGGTDYYDDGTSFFGWYYYPYLYPDYWWWNIWFYDHPFDYSKYKEIYVSFWCDPIEPVWFVVNYATDNWYYEGEIGRPPLPPDVPNPQIEDFYIGRLPSPYQPILVEPGFNEFSFTIEDYNPEWVSIDFMGADFVVYDGNITHSCLPPDLAKHLDLAFVITGEAPCDPCIELSKYVWDSEEGIWVDEIEACISENVSFNITVCSCGTCDLTDIIITDTLPDCLEYVEGSSTWFEPSIVGNNLTWDFSDHHDIDPLEPSWCFAIEFDAHVILEGDNTNCAEVNASSSEGSVSDSDCATVNAIECINESDLSCSGTLHWPDIKRGSTVSGIFTVSNTGDSGSELDWEIVSYPEWGSWIFTPEDGEDLEPADGPVTVSVSVVAPTKRRSEFLGEVKVVNKDDSSDYCTIQVSLVTSKNKQYIHPILIEFLENHPLIYNILLQILGLYY